MRIAVLVLSWNAADALLACLQALAQQQTPADELFVVVVDNGSDDGAPEQVAAQFPAVHLVRNERNLGFSGGMNVGLATLQSLPEPPEIVVLLNQDTLVDPGWLAAISAPFADGQVGAVGCKIRYPDGTLQHAGIALDERAVVRHLGAGEPDKGQYDQQREVHFVTGAALALRTSALQQVGVFDEGYAPAYFEDLDLCWRLRLAGYKVVYAPAATLIHQESLSLRDQVQRSAYYNRGRLRFVLKSFPLDVLHTTFLEAEKRWVSEQLWVDEARVLRWAYGETLLSLPEILATRRLLEPGLPETALAQFQSLLHSLHQARTVALRRNALARADQFFT
jgi:O-antigen biosynthesis protein